MKYNSIPEMIRAKSTEYGKKEALRYFDRSSDEVQSISWSQLVGDFTRLSNVLLANKICADDNIGIFSSNCPEWTVADLSVLNIGAVVVPFFATASKEQCLYMVNETEMKLLFVGDKEQLEIAVWLVNKGTSLQKVVVFNPEVQLPENERFISFDQFVQMNPHDSNAHDEIDFQPALADLATIIYTSGTTGEPKGVMLTHENFLYTFEIHTKRLDLNENDVSMCFLPLSHIFERSWTYYVLYSGGINFYLENPRTVIDRLPIAQPTVMCTVPRFFEKTYEGIQTEAENWPLIKKKVFDWSISAGMQYSSKKSTGKSVPVLTSLKKLIAEKLVLRKLRMIFGGKMRTMPCSGAALSQHLLTFFHAAGLFVNYGYGATETTATVSCFKTDEYDFESCGTIMPGIEVKISDEREILVKGRTIFKGYYKKPEATKEALQGGWYHTGDEGYINEKGNLVMTDRLKDLMKTSGGKYISPQKLESLLGRDPLIEQIVVVGDNRKYVTALIVPVVSTLQSIAREQNIGFEKPGELFDNQAVHEIIMRRIEQLQEELSEYEKIREFLLLPEPFSIENNMLTSTLKTRRKIIVKEYSEQIDKMY